jgi:hypothetical protein
MRFTAPAASGSILKPSEVENHLLVVIPQEYIPSMQTQMGESQAVRVTVHDITDQRTFDNALWFGKALVSSLKSMVGQSVLAVMGKGVAKAGQSAPWMLIDASGKPDAVNAATAYLARIQSSQLAPATASNEATPTGSVDSLAYALQSLNATVIAS